MVQQANVRNGSEVDVAWLGCQLRPKPIDAASKTAFHSVKSVPTYLCQLAFVFSLMLIGLLKSRLCEENNSDADGGQEAYQQSGCEKHIVEAHPATLLPFRRCAMSAMGRLRTFDGMI